MKSHKKFRSHRIIALLIIIPFLCFFPIKHTHAGYSTLYVKVELPEDSLENTREIQVAYGSFPQEKVVSSISTLFSNEIEKNTVSNVGYALTGRLPGLTVFQNSSDLGINPSFLIRGTNAFVNNPLIIIDGFEGSLDQLTVYDIESVSVLKDASALALYGQKAANGVILVTTKKGDKGKTRVDFVFDNGWQFTQSMPDLLNAHEFATLYREALINDELAVPEKYSEEAIEMFAREDKNLLEAALYPNVHFHEELLKRSSNFLQGNLNIRGGDDKVKYMASFGYLGNEGIFKYTEENEKYSTQLRNDRFTIRTNLDINLTEKLSANVKIAGNLDNRNYPGRSTSDIISSMYYIPPTEFPIINPDGTPGASSQFVYNPYGLISKTGYRRLSNGNVNAILRLNYSFKGVLEGLNAGIGGSISNEMSSWNNQIKPEFAVYSLSLPAGTDPSDTANIDNLIYTKYNDDSDPFWEYPSSNFQHKFFESYLNYDIIKGDHSIHAMVRMQMDSYQHSGNHYVFSNASIGSRIHYSLKNKYIAEFTGGYHGMEQYSDGNRFGFFPAIGLGWILSRENFLVSNRFINYLKLRGSAGILGGSMSYTGNDVNSRIFHTQYYSRTSSVYFGETNQNEIYGITESTIANPLITWDKLRTFNAGIEGSFFNHLDLTFDYFDEYRYDILTINNQHPMILGYSGRQPYMNDAIIKNNGIEATVTIRGAGNNFSYRISGSLWSNLNEIVRNPAATLYKDEYRSEIGKRVGQIMGFETLGFFASDEDAQNATVKQTFGQVGAGDVIYKDQNSDGIIDDLDKVAMGYSYVPEYNYSANLYLSYRNFNLSILGQGIINSSFMMEGYFQPFNGYRNSFDYALERWHEGNKESAKYPRLSSVTNQNNSQPSDIWLRSLDYFKIRHAELGYDLPAKLKNHMNVENLRIFVRGMNLFTWTKEIDFMDPEIMTGYPGMTSVTFGIKTSF